MYNVSVTFLHFMRDESNEILLYRLFEEGGTVV